MKAKLQYTLSLVVILGTSSCSSPPLQDRTSTEPAAIRIVVPKTDPDSVDLAKELLATAKKQYGSGRFDSARRTLEKAVEVDPRNPKAWYYLHRVKDSIRERDRQEQERRDLLRRWHSSEEFSLTPNQSLQAKPLHLAIEWFMERHHFSS